MVRVRPLVGRRTGDLGGLGEGGEYVSNFKSECDTTYLRKRGVRRAEVYIIYISLSWLRTSDPRCLCVEQLACLLVQPKKGEEEEEGGGGGRRRRDKRYVRKQLA